jgi:acetoin utilization protein AcuB
MTRDVVVIGPQFPIAAAFGLMQERRIRHLPVVCGGRILGIVSDRDVLARSTVDPDGTVVPPRDPVAVAMTPAPITCSPDAQVSDLARIMVERKIDAVPVVNKAGSLVGLVTSSDLLFLLIDVAPAQVLPFDFRMHQGERLAALA